MVNMNKFTFFFLRAPYLLSHKDIPILRSYLVQLYKDLSDYGTKSNMIHKNLGQEVVKTRTRDRGRLTDAARLCAF
jgi:hypothetical protein